MLWFASEQKCTNAAVHLSVIFQLFSRVSTVRIIAPPPFVQTSNWRSKQTFPPPSPKREAFCYRSVGWNPKGRVVKSASSLFPAGRLDPPSPGIHEDEARALDPGSPSTPGRTSRRPSSSAVSPPLLKVRIFSHPHLLIPLFFVRFRNVPRFNA